MNKKLSWVFLFLTCALFLSGCAYRWQKPGATEQDFEAAKAACNAQAAAHFPPLMRPVQLNNGYTTPVTTDCHGHGNEVHCVTSGGQYVPPSTTFVDDNEAAREQDVHACFFQNGWQMMKD